MTWLQPLAWMGLGAIAVPVLVHLLTRRPVTRRVWPTLRFIEPMSIQPTRRWRVSDPLLLALRCAIVGLAVAALAGPRLLTGMPDSVPRVAAIIVDTSASMSVPDAAGAAAATEAQTRAAALAAEFSRVTTIETEHPGLAIPGALGWLTQQAGRAELVVISDFQRGAVDAAEIALVPEAIGVRIIRTGAAIRPALNWPVGIRAGRSVETAVKPGAMDVAVSWQRREAVGAGAAATVAGRVRLFAGEPDRGGLEALAAAVSQQTSAPAEPSPATSMAVVFPSFRERAAWIAAAVPVNQPWMHAALRSLSRHDDQGRHVVASGVHPVEGVPTLVVFSPDPPDSLAAASLVATLVRMDTAAIPPGEFDPIAIDTSVLQRWERPGTLAREVPADRSGPSDGRWLWALVLLLLGLEWAVRRRMAARAAEVADHARAA